VQEVALYDPNRKPASWMEVIQPMQYAVLFRDVETGAELTSDGHYLDTGMMRSCLIFDSLEEAEQYCRRRVEDIPNLRCDVFDSHGRANPPVATFVSQRYEDRLESQAKAGRMMRWPFFRLQRRSHCSGTRGRPEAKGGWPLFLASNSFSSVCDCSIGATA